jgi:hypothetical protein
MADKRNSYPLAAMRPPCHAPQTQSTRVVSDLRETRLGPSAMKSPSPPLSLLPLRCVPIGHPCTRHTPPPPHRHHPRLHTPPPLCRRLAGFRRRPSLHHHWPLTRPRARPPLPAVGSHNLQRGRREEKKVMKFGCSKFKFILKLNWMLKIGMLDNLNVN